MSESSQVDSSPEDLLDTGASLKDIELKFDVVTDYEFFDVEVAQQGADMVYHFWPKDDGRWFLPDADSHEVFGTALEQGFVRTVPEGTDMRADYTSPQESAVLLRFGENPDSEAKPRETYWVRVIGLANNPMSDRFLKGEVFRNIEQAVREAL